MAASSVQQSAIRDVVLTHAHLDHIAGLPLFIDDLFSTSILGLGVGVIQRYGAYAEPNALKNFTYKIALRLALN